MMCMPRRQKTNNYYAPSNITAKRRKVRGRSTGGMLGEDEKQLKLSSTDIQRLKYVYTGSQRQLGENEKRETWE